MKRSKTLNLYEDFRLSCLLFFYGASYLLPLIISWFTECACFSRASQTNLELTELITHTVIIKITKFEVRILKIHVKLVV